MQRTMVSYRVKPERVAENDERVRAVLAELAETEPPGLHYAVFKLGDGESFVHLAVEAGADSALTSLDSFRAFRAGLEDRIVGQVRVERLSEVGAHAMAWPPADARAAA